MNDREIVLARMRVGVARLRLMQCDIEEAAAFLKAGHILPAGAVAMLHATGVADLCGFSDGDNGFRLANGKEAA